MKATLIVIQDDSDHADAKALVARLMGSDDPRDRARMVAQARLVEGYERSRWPRRTPALPDLLAYLMDQHGLSRQRGPERQAGVEPDDGAQAARALWNLRGPVDLNGTRAAAPVRRRQ